MAESVIFNSYILLSGYALAVFLCVFDLIRPSSGYVLPIISATLAVITTIAAILMGAALMEVILVVLIFLALNLTAYGRRGGDGE